MRSNPLSSTPSTALKLLPTTKDPNNGIAEKALEKDGFASGTPANRLPNLLHKLQLSLQYDSDQVIEENVKSTLFYLQENNLDDIEKEGLSLKTLTMDIEKLLDQRKDSLSEDTTLDIKKLLSKLNTKLNHVSNITDTLVFTTTKQDLKEGFYTVNSLSEAQKFSGDPEFFDEVVNTLSAMLQKYGKIVFRVYGDDTNGFFISALAPQAAAQELISVVKTFNSQLLQSLPQEVLTLILDRKNTIQLDVLKNMDILLEEATIHFPYERAGSQSAAIAASTNWLDMTLDYVSMQKKPAEFFPPTLASKIITDAANLNDLLNNFPSNGADSLQVPGITEEFIKSNEKSRAIPLIFSNLGYDLESTILYNKFSHLPLSYKAELLHLQNQFSNISDLPMTINNKYATHQKELLSRKHETSENSDSLKHSNLIAENLSDSLQTLYRSSSELNNFYYLQNNNHLPLIINISDQFAKVISNLTQALHSIQEKFQSISEQVNITTIQKQLQQLEQIVKNIDSTYVNSFTLVIELKKRLSELISSQSALLSAISEGVNQNSDTDSIISETKSLSAETDQNFSLHTQLRHTVESSLGRLESLQLLARPQLHSEGQQQMLALPMKIGNEWTEVNITFIKRKKSSKKDQNQPQNYSVSLNLAPKQLGSISIKMEYFQKKSLNISMTFETEITKNYFEKFNTEIRSALKNLGFSMHTLNFKRKKDDADQKNTFKLDTLIDMKV